MLKDLIQKVLDMEAYLEARTLETRQIVERLNDHGRGDTNTDEYRTLRDRKNAILQEDLSYEDDYDCKPGLLRQAKEAVYEYVMAHREEISE